MKMQYLALAGAALLASTALASAADVVRVPPAPAPVLVTPGSVALGCAFVSASAGQLDLNIPGVDNIHADRLNVRGSAAMMFSPVWGVQFDAMSDNAHFEGIGVNTLNVAGHLYARSANGLIGGFAQYRNISIIANVDAWAVGAEAQWYHNNFALNGQLAYETGSLPGSILGHIPGRRQRQRLQRQRQPRAEYIHPNWKLAVDAAYDHLSSSGTDINVTTFGVSTEVRTCTGRSACSPATITSPPTTSSVNRSTATSGWRA